MTGSVARVFNALHGYVYGSGFRLIMPDPICIC